MKDICSNGISEIENEIKKVKKATQMLCTYIEEYMKFTMCYINIGFYNYLDDRRIYEYMLLF